MYNRLKAPICLAITGLLGFSCADTADLENRLNDLEGRLDDIETEISAANAEINAMSSLAKSGIFIVGYTELGHGYRLDLSSTESSQSIEVTYGEELGTDSILLGIDEDGNWTVSTDGGQTSTPVEGADNARNPESAVPEVTVDSENYWCIRYGADEEFERILDEDGNPISAQLTGMTGSFRNVEYDESTGQMNFTLASGTVISVPVIETFYLNVKDYVEGQPICLNETLVYEVEMSDVESAHIMDVPGWEIILEDTRLTVIGPASGTEGEVDVQIYLVSTDHLMKTVSLTFTLKPVELDANAVKEYNDFLAGNADNVLLDFSYAGYMHGETAPPDVAIMESGGKYIASNGYTVYNVMDYGAIPDDGKSDREAFLAVLTEIAGKEPTLNTAGDQLTFPSINSAKAVIYFPEGNFILHTEEDDANGKSQSIIIRCGDLIMKGAGRDLTTLEMAAPNQPSQGPSVMYSSPDMIQFKHNTGIRESNPVVLANVTGNSAKGAYSVTVDAVGTGMTEDAWVCLYLKNSDANVVAEELSPYTASSGWEIATSGVNVIDLHQIKSISGNTITFYEPLMHAVDADWGWQILRYQHYENVGIEDLCFEGHAKDRFDHHYSWEDDGAYKPVSMTRLTNSWMRRVKFDSVSEACSVIESANVSVYDVEIGGTRGHSAIRSQGSSRVFIGAVKDLAEGYRMDDLGHEVEGTEIEWTGQYHAVGVSKQSMGAVLWRNTWGYDSCFESHATQPRATLIDCCTGGWRRWRQGGDDAQMPNHLADLTVWNFENTTPYSGTWVWWDSGSSWWKFLPPIIVGFHGEPVKFDTDQTLRLNSNGTAVQPESLYEAQLRARLGYVPAWLNALK